MADSQKIPRILDLQTNRSLPTPGGMEQGDSLILPPAMLSHRLRHFAEEVYDIGAETHIARFMKVILGDAGAGYRRKRTTITRLQEALGGTHFFDIDRFYGAIFGVGRLSRESISIDPSVDFATPDEWDDILASDAAYRGRVEQFARAIHLGATPAGIEALAEALLGVDVEITEGYIRSDLVVSTWGDVEDAYPTYGDLDGVLYDTLEGGDGSVASTDRWLFSVIPKRVVSDEEHYSLVRALMRFKPANSYFSVLPGRVGAFTNIPLSGAWSDSEAWEIKRLVAPPRDGEAIYGNGGTESVELPIPPYTGYQGEAWSYIPGAVGVSTYELEPVQEQIPLNDPERRDYIIRYSAPGTRLPDDRVLFLDGTHIDYQGLLALQSSSDILAGRAASDGILVSNPFVSRTDKGSSSSILGYSGGSSPALMVDGLPVDDVAKVVKGQGRSTMRSLNNRFWSTDQHLSSEPVPVVIEVQFDEAKLVNYFTFEVPTFPHVGVLQVLPPDSTEWVTIHQHDVRTSFPQRIQTLVDPEPGVHPQHGAPGHWRKVSGTLDPPVTGSRFRLVLQRITQGVAPVDRNGREVPYSLGVKSMDLGYRVYSLDDVPSLSSPDDQEWSSTVDVLGNRVTHGLRRWEASNTLSGGSTPWWSDPIPTREGVVSLYLDLRDSDGAAQTIERLWVDPMTEGVPFNIYWARGDDALDPGKFKATTSYLNPSLVQIESGASSGPDGILYGPGSSIRISNTATRLDDDVPWWMGLAIKPSAPSNEAQTILAIEDSGGGAGMTVRGDGDQTTLRITSLSDVATPVEATIPLAWGTASNVYISLGFDPATGVATISGRVGQGDVVSATAHIPGLVLKPKTLVVGDAGDDGVGGTIHSLIVKKWVDPARDAERFFWSPDDYAVIPRWASQDRGTTDNAVLRYHPSFYSENESIPIKGGMGAEIEGARWVPVPRTYRLQRGYIQLPPIHASYLKLEFSSLAPRWYEPFVPIQRRVKLWPSNMDTGFATTEGAMDSIPGMRTMAGTTPEFSDREAETTTAMDPSTMALYAPDPVVAARMRDSSPWIFGYQPWHPESSIPSWGITSKHHYQEVILEHSSKVAFQVGIKSISALRVNQGNEEDTMAYVDHLYDTSGLASSTWSANPGYIWSTTAPSVMTSKTMASRSRVRAIQFATQQSDPIQILRNDGFNDPATSLGLQPRNVAIEEGVSDFVVVCRDIDLAEITDVAERVDGDENFTITDHGDGMVTVEWPFIHEGIVWEFFYLIRRNPTAWHAWGDARVTHLLGERALRVSRSLLPEGMWRPVSPDGMEQPPTSPILSFRDGGGAGSIGYGGVESPFAVTSKRGTVGAAVRFSSEAGLTQPLMLQIIAADDETVLAEKEITARPGEMVEEYVTYRIGDNYSDGSLPDYAARHLTNDIPHPIMDGEDPLVDLNTNMHHSMRVRLVQHGISSDTWKIHRLSMFDESIIWEFSVDAGSTWQDAPPGVRNNPDGLLVMRFPDTSLRWRATSYRRGLAISAIQVRPWYQGNTSVRHILPHRSGNVSMWDQDPPIYEDPMFKAHHRFIPSWWFISGQRWPTEPMPLDDSPVITEHARSYSRVIETSLATPTDDATRSIVAERVLTDTIPEASSAVSRTAGDFARESGGEVGVEGEARGRVLPRTSHMVDRPMRSAHDARSGTVEGESSTTIPYPNGSVEGEVNP